MLIDKGTISSAIAKKVFEESSKKGTVSMIKIDDYYKILDHLSMEERVKVNYDHPDAYDIDLLVEHINNLKNGLSIKVNEPLLITLHLLSFNETFTSPI